MKIKEDLRAYYVIHNDGDRELERLLDLETGMETIKDTSHNITFHDA